MSGAGEPVAAAGPAAPVFTVLLPVLRGPELLPLAVESVLAQTEPSFELIVICDGAPAATVSCAEDFARRDPRVSVRAFPKGERHGEAHRHTVLGEARGSLVAQIADDDQWFPDHLRELRALLADVDFGNLLMAFLREDGTVGVHAGDLGDPWWREILLNRRRNFFGPTCAGYRMSAYRSLGQGWTPAPAEIWSDLHMWRKFLACPGLRFGTRPVVEAMTLPNAARGDHSVGQRVAEAEALAARIRTGPGRAGLREAAAAALLQEVTRLGKAEEAARVQVQTQGDRQRRDRAELRRLQEARRRLAAERARALQEARGARREARRATRELAQVRSSHSWVLTAPLRRAARIARRRMPGARAGRSRDRGWTNGG